MQKQTCSLVLLRKLNAETKNMELSAAEEV